MSEVISLISGKGGTGKTTLCAALATCLAAEEHRVLCIDGDIGLRNLDIALGMSEQPTISFMDVIQCDYPLSSAAVHTQLKNLQLLTAPVRENDELVDIEGFGRMIAQAKLEYDYILIDSAAGIGNGFRLATEFADHVLVVCTPDPSSLRDAERAADLLALRGKEEVHLIVNRVRPRALSKIALTIDDMMDATGLPLIGLVPEDVNVLYAAASGTPLVYATERGAADACLRIADRLQGETVPLMKL